PLDDVLHQRIGLGEEGRLDRDRLMVAAADGAAGRIAALARLIGHDAGSSFGWSGFACGARGRGGTVKTWSRPIAPTARASSASTRAAARTAATPGRRRT